ncbi:MAG: DMT family transporter [Gemmatimonas sp.]|uniref:DMT family transporter n=1 Tax=Gemmatimonas sp. TaxID=1962908 RepID=UPI0025BF26C2|nr:DMT family transporter [Gemmatimonas sp.]MCE2954706.1 DMT family transporter [Gemmatimonas sp.]
MTSTDRHAVGGARLGVWLVVAAAFQWALLGPVARVAFAEGIAPLTVAFWRATVAALLFAAHASVTRAHALRQQDRLPAMLLGVVAVAGLYVSYFESVQRGGAALAAILLYSAPVWVALGAHFVLRERVPAREAGALLLTFAGVVLVALFPASGAADIAATPAAVSWGLASGLAYAMYFLLGRSLFAHNAPARVMGWALATGAVVLAPFVQWATLTWRAWAAIGFLATVATYGAYLSNANGLKRIGASRASTIATLEPILAVGAAFLLWGERLSLLGVVGASAVIGGVVLAATASRRTAT